LTRARELRGLTQAEIADRLSRYTGTPWSATTVAQAEGSVSGNRVRQFTANELVALARTFDLPVLWFFVPPEDATGEFRTPDRSTGWPWEYLCLLVWGHRKNLPAFADRAAPWAHASTVLIPDDDMLDSDPEHWELADSRYERLTPDDVVAVALNGLARRRIRGSHIVANMAEKPAETLRALANLLEAFENYPPGAFLDSEQLRRIGRERRRDPPDG
jgi:transcriptional regulator with XRE-family HTH domain